MNQPPDGPLSRTDRSIGGVLSAVGSLLQALGGERGASESAPAPTPAAPLEVPPAPMVLPPSAIPPTWPPTLPPPAAQGARAGAAGPVDEVSALLADARARAQAIMDESMARAETLLRPPEAAEPETLVGIRRTVTDIAADVRAIHARLDTIEALVRGHGTAAPPDAASTPRTPPVAEPLERPAFGSTQFAESQPAVAAPPEVPAAAVPVAPASPPEVPSAPAAPPPLPTSWAGLGSPPPVEAAPTPPSVPVTPAPAAQTEPTSDAFDPMAGAVSLRISPVAGFQGLMRVQDALVRIRGVREAGVEAYAQGEARLRLRLSASMDASAIAAALTDLLGRPTRVVTASKTERTLQLELE